MTGPLNYGMGPSSVGFGPTSVQANEMMASPLVQQNIHDFLKSGKIVDEWLAELRVGRTRHKWRQ